MTDKTKISAFHNFENYVRNIFAAKDDADSALEFALSTICSSFNPDVPPVPCDGTGVGAIGLAKAADVAIQTADDAIEASINAMDPNTGGPFGTIAAADAAVEAADAAVEASDAAIEAADKAVEKADRLVEAAGG